MSLTQDLSLSFIGVRATDASVLVFKMTSLWIFWVYFIFGWFHSFVEMLKIVDFFFTKRA